MEGFSDTAFAKDIAFSSLAFAFSAGPTPTVVVGGHFLPRKKVKQRDYTEVREAKERLRAQLRRAIEGEPEAFTQYIEPQKTDSVYLSPVERIDWEKVYQDADRVQRMISQLEDEDDDDFLLLS